MFDILPEALVGIARMAFYIDGSGLTPACRDVGMASGTFNGPG